MSFSCTQSWLGCSCRNRNQCNDEQQPFALASAAVRIKIAVLGKLPAASRAESLEELPPEVVIESGHMIADEAEPLQNLIRTMHNRPSI